MMSHGLEDCRFYEKSENLNADLDNKSLFFLPIKKSIHYISRTNLWQRTIFKPM